MLKPDGQVLLIEFHPASSPTIMGKLTHLSIAFIEFLAGWEHYSNSRQFLSQGGIPNLTDGKELVVRKTKVVGNGNLGVYLLGLY